MSGPSIDWDVRPRAVRRSPIDRVVRDIGISPLGGQWVYTPAVPNQLITADFYNSTQQNIINNFVPTKMDDYSSTVAQMQAETDPNPGGGASQAATLAGELERLRFCIHSLNLDALSWYQVPALGIKPIGGLTLPNNVPLYSVNTAGTKVPLLRLGTDNNLHIGVALPTGSNINIGAAATPTTVAGGITLSQGFNSRAQSTMAKGAWLMWDDINGIVVDTSNQVLLGWNAASTHTNTRFYAQGVTSHQHLSALAGATVDGGLTSTGYFSANSGITVSGSIYAPGGMNIRANLTHAKGTWDLWDDIYGVAIDGSNNMYIGSGGQIPALVIDPPVTFARNVTMAGALSVGGQPVTGSGMVRAWCRWLGGFAGNYGFSQGYAVGYIGQHYVYRFILNQPLNGGFAVSAMIEIDSSGMGNTIARIIVESAQQFLVCISNTESNPIGANFQLIVAGA